MQMPRGLGETGNRTTCEQMDSEPIEKVGPAGISGWLAVLEDEGGIVCRTPLCFGQQGSAGRTQEVRTVGKAETGCSAGLGELFSRESISLSLSLSSIESTMVKDKAVSFAKLAVFFVIYCHTELWNTAMK